MSMMSDGCEVDAERYPITFPHVIALTLRTPFNLNQSHALINVTYTGYVMPLCYAVTLCLSRVQRS